MSSNVEAGPEIPLKDEHAVLAKQLNKALKNQTKKNGRLGGWKLGQRDCRFGCQLDWIISMSRRR